MVNSNRTNMKYLKTVNGSNMIFDVKLQFIKLPETSI